MSRAYQVVLVATFCALLCLPGPTMLLRPETPQFYGVKPVTYPEFRWSTQWLADFEAYFTANLGYKLWLVRLHNLFGYRVLGDLQGDSVLVGRKDWLFLKQDHGWESFRSEVPLSEANEKAWERSFKGAQRWLGQRGIPFLFVIPPSKESIYPEFLPASATRARSVSRLDEMLVLLDSAQIDHLELRGPLLRAKGNARLFDRIDSHWNGMGARVGAELLLKRVAELLHRPASFAELNARIIDQRSEGDLSLLLSLHDTVTEPSNALVPNPPLRAKRVVPPESVRELTRRQMNRMVFEVEDESLPRALILRDSFAEAWMPTLVEKFRRSVWIWTHGLDLSAVAQEKPDIVIVEMTERFLSGDPPRLTTRQRRR